MFLLTTVLLTTLAECVLACSCMGSHPKNMYCQGEMVIRGNVTEKEEVNYGPDMWWGGENIFHVDVVEVFKKPEGSDIDIGSVIRLSSPTSGSMCGRNLPLNEDLLIAGDGERVGLCNWIEPYSTSQRALFELYDCDCMVKSYKWEQSRENAGSCFGWGSACIKYANTGCTWVEELWNLWQ